MIFHHCRWDCSDKYVFLMSGTGNNSGAAGAKPSMDSGVAIPDMKNVDMSRVKLPPQEYERYYPRTFQDNPRGHLFPLMAWEVVVRLALLIVVAGKHAVADQYSDLPASRG